MKRLIAKFYRRLTKPVRVMADFHDWLLGRTSVQSGPLRTIIGVQQAHFVQQLLGTAKYQDPRNLSKSEHQVFSQSGEDGIIREIFRRVGVTNKVFAELGIGDGLECNTTFLLWQSWSGYWIDKTDKPANIFDTFKLELSTGSLKFANSFVTAENIVGLFRELGVPQEPDLLSVDIDMNTYYVWKSLREYKPRVVVVEYNAVIPSDMEWVVAYDQKSAWRGNHYFGASLKSLELLGLEMGYKLVGCGIAGINAYFVREDLCDEQKFQSPFTSETHFEPARFFLTPMRGTHRRSFRG